MFDRSTGIGATDARLIMDGSWHELWLQKTKRADPPDLSDIFRVQLGKVTEAFHCEWIARRQTLDVMHLYEEHPLQRRIDVANQWRYVTLDAWDRTNNVPIEVKHSNSMANIRQSADYYMAQLQHNLAVTQADWLWFSVIPGNDEPMTVKVERNEEYIERLTHLERTFWWHVTEDVEPEILPLAEIEKVNALADQILVGGYQPPIDMTKHNEWPVLAAEYIDLKPKVDRCAEVNKLIKALVPAERAGAYGHGLTLSRNKKGDLTLRIDKAE